MDLESYQPTDPYFGTPFFDVDEAREKPVPHRYLHGGFGGTDTRFAIYLPPAERWQGRFFQALGGGQGGDEFAQGPDTMLGQFLGSLKEADELGGFFLESNQGHIQSAADPNADDLITLHGYRATVEAARFARWAAEQVYGRPVTHGYIFGGGGGGRRCVLAFENAPGVWDGVFHYDTAGSVHPDGATRATENPIYSNFSAMLNTRRVLGPKLADLIDAVEPGGSGDPFAGLDLHQREALAELHALGFPGGEVHLALQIGPTAVWATTADTMLQSDPGYFDAFWSRPGYAGCDQPEHYARYVVHQKATVDRLVTNDDLKAEIAVGGPAAGSPLAFWWTVVYPPALQVGAAFDERLAVDLIGARVAITSGRAAGRRLYCRDTAGDAVLLDGNGDAGLLRLTDVLPGDEVEIDNRDFLAFCHWYRHHLMPAEKGFARFISRGHPIYPQRPETILDNGNGGGAFTARFTGKMLSLQFTPDTMIWPDQPVSYAEAVVENDPTATERFCLRWVENAENAPPQFMPKTHPDLSTRNIDYSGIVRQTLADLVAWVEDGVAPAATDYTFENGRLSLPADAAERGGIQPVVTASANGAPRADVKVGEAVALEVKATVPPGAGTVVAADWDFDGTGAFPFAHAGIDGTDPTVTLCTTHTFDRPGTYFPAVRVRSHRGGNVDDTPRHIENIGRVRVVVAI